MSLKIETNNSAVAYHVTDGEQLFPYAIDARSAIARFPNEWSETPWDKSGKKAIPIIEIPSDWQDLKPSERIALAIKLTGADRKGLTAAHADDLIAAELDGRHASAEA